ncbi:MAG: DNA/pantothenate metabolism flavoprotein [Halobacteriales archaeon]|nr:DNA/pantothenate metabolism flavoprotein [Halobacteriales archaeon]
MQPLAGQRIVLGVTGSIGAVQSPYLAARLRSLGAEVQPVLTRAAQQLVGAEALREASGAEPVLALTGAGEHVRELLPDGADALLIAPCTANTLGSIVHGLDDNPVTTFASVLLGQVPVLLAPAMHDTMWDNPAVRASLARARDLGITLVAPAHEERSAKLASLDDIVAHVGRALGPGTLRGRRLLVVTGPTREPLGQDLWLSNRSSGGTGLALAREAWRRGAEVEVWLGGEEAAPTGCTLERFATVDDLLARAPQAAGFDAVLVPAAIGDYRAPQPVGPQGGSLPLEPMPKFVDAVRAGFPGPLVCFKAESGLDDKALVAKARALQERVHALLVVANALEKVGPRETSALLVDREGGSPFRGTKEELAERILDRVARGLP